MRAVWLRETGGPEVLVAGGGPRPGAALGPGVDTRHEGRRVVSSMGGSGGYAELAVVDAAGLIDVPAGVGLDTALALVADGRTAMSLMRAAAPRSGGRV